MIHVVVTGASRGIGFGLAVEFVRAGCRVTVTSRDGASLERALADLRATASPDAVLGVPCDVSKPDQVLALAEFAERIAPVDVWVNNAGRNLPPVPLWEQDPTALSDLVASNLNGVVLGSHAGLRAMVPRGRGKIYNMEGFGADGAFLHGFAPYGATKRAVRYFSQALARETKQTGVLVATVDPGIVETDMFSSIHPTMQPWLRKVSNLLSQPVSAVAPPLARSMLDNRKTGVRLRAVGLPWVVWRLITGTFLPRGEPDLKRLKAHPRD
jgi:NAD(P)-dependent dehydrogenase (short-subunit alcohol dehydrogenase family)